MKKPTIIILALLFSSQLYAAESDPSKRVALYCVDMDSIFFAKGTFQKKCMKAKRELKKLQETATTPTK